MQAGQSPKIINLHGPLTVDRASALKAEIAGALEESDNVLLSISLVEELDLACLQVFYAARAEAAAAGKELHFLGSVPSKVAKRLAASGFLRGLSDHAEEFESALVGF
jgi:anti-anti-sigma regulatory factor